MSRDRAVLSQIDLDDTYDEDELPVTGGKYLKLLGDIRDAVQRGELAEGRFVPIARFNKKQSAIQQASVMRKEFRLFRFRWITEEEGTWAVLACWRGVLDDVDE